MAVKIRLMRVGKKKQPTYRVVVADGRSPRDGRFIEIIGQYAPRQEPSGVEINAESALAWLRKGAQPTEQVQKLLAVTGVWEQYEAERGKPAVTKLSRRGYVTGKVAPKVKAAKEEPAKEEPAKEAAPATAPKAEAAPVEEATEVAVPEPEPERRTRCIGRSRVADRGCTSGGRRMTDDNLDDDYEDDDYEDEVGGEGNRIVGARARAVAEHVTRNLADDPDAIEVEVEERRGGEVSLLVHANPDDMGRLIGRRGRVIQALRQLVRAAGSADGVKANVDIAE